MEMTARTIAELGVLAVIAGAFIYLAVLRQNWILKEFAKCNDEHSEQVIEFTRVAEDFNQVVINHMAHEEEAFRALTKAVEKLCITLEK